MKLLFIIVPALIALVFVVVIVSTIYQIVRGFAEWSRNNSLPVQQSAARVVSRRIEIRGRTGHRPRGRVSTFYYATFEDKAGDRSEFRIPGPTYGLLAEGDEGVLTHQGTRYHDFQRAGAKAMIDRDF